MTSALVQGREESQALLFPHSGDLLRAQPSGLPPVEDPQGWAISPPPPPHLGPHLEEAEGR